MDTTPTTAQLRSAARDCEVRLDYAQAAQLYTDAADRYPRSAAVSPRQRLWSADARRM